MTTEAVLEVVAATESVREFLLEQVVVVEGGHSPCLLPQGTDHLLSTSVQFAVLLGQSIQLSSHPSRKFFYYSGTWSNGIYFSKFYISVVSSKRCSTWNKCSIKLY